MNEQSTYKEIIPNAELKDFVHSFWMHQNNSDSVEKTTIVPDSYFKIVLLFKSQKIISYFITGLWLDEKEFSFAPNTTSVGIRLKVLAPEFLLNREVASISQKMLQLNLDYLNADKLDLSSFETIVDQWQKELLSIKPQKTIQRINLSQEYKTHKNTKVKLLQLH